MNRVFCLGVTAFVSVCVGFSAKAGAQFATVEHATAANVHVTPTQVCDTSAFPPFNRFGLWSFALCDSGSAIVSVCYITASRRAVQGLPASMMRRTLLRLIENHDARNEVEQGRQGALMLFCHHPEDQSS